MINWFKNLFKKKEEELYWPSSDPYPYISSYSDYLGKYKITIHFNDGSRVDYELEEKASEESTTYIDIYPQHDCFKWDRYTLKDKDRAKYDKLYMGKFLNIYVLERYKSFVMDLSMLNAPYYNFKQVDGSNISYNKDSIKSVVINDLSDTKKLMIFGYRLAGEEE